jgi:hypothetical protein
MISDNNWMSVNQHLIGSVKQLNLDGKLNKIWGSILEAEKETNLLSSKIVVVKNT